jgi:hypothetical protein
MLTGGDAMDNSGDNSSSKSKFLELLNKLTEPLT